MDGIGIKSKDRVKAYGEVFTPDSIVNDMLNLVDEEFVGISDDEYISKTILEPACGDGQFLVRILFRKLDKVKNYNQEDRYYYLMKAISTIYGVDIQEDNAAKKTVNKMMEGTFDLNDEIKYIQINLGIQFTDEMKLAIKTILDNNIIHGNTLEPESIEFISYHFNDSTRKVSIARSLLSNLDIEYGATDEVNPESISNIIVDEEILDW